MNYTTTSTPFVKGLATLGVLLAAGTVTGFAATAINASKSFDDLEMQAPTLKVSTPALSVNGTGSLQYKFSFHIDNGCCMRVTASLMRQPVLSIGISPISKGAVSGGAVLQPTVVTSKTFEICNALEAQTLSTTLSATQDDANFFVQFTNPDSWDKAHLTIDHISALYPTPILALVTDPSTALTLLQGQDQDRTFNVPDGKVGKLSISLNWTGGARMKLEVFKPGSTTAVQSVTSAAGASTLTVPDIAVTANDAGDWKLTYTNVSSSNLPANSISTKINFTVNE